MRNIRLCTLIFVGILSIASVGFSAPASDIQSNAVKQLVQQLQTCLQEGEYETAWTLLTKEVQDREFSGKSGLPISELLSKARVNLEGLGFFELRPKLILADKGVLVTNVKHDNRTWTMEFVEENDHWKINRFDISADNWKERLLPQLQKRITEHVDIYYYKDSTAETEIEQICKRREQAFREICQFLGQDLDIRICVVFFEDEKTKYAKTMHRGMGWAFGQTLVEVYNETQKVDPYHEAVHVLMNLHGNPPSLFDEGFATYLAKELRGKSNRLYRYAKRLKISGDWIDLEKLITIEIGPDGDYYSQAGAFVKFLIDNYGKDKSLEAYKVLKTPDDKTIQDQNIKELKQIYGKTLSELEKEFEKAIDES